MKYCAFHRSGFLALAFVALAMASVGCLPELNDPDRGPLVSTFAVSDYFTPSGFMGDGASEGFLSIQVNQGCKEPRPANAQGYCYVFTYYDDTATSNFWAGVYWVFPANSWGSRPGYAIQSQNFKQVRFSAAVEFPTPNTKNGGSSSFNAIAGKINAGNYGPTEHNDVIDEENTYTVGKDIGSDLKQYSLDLTTQPPAPELIGAFAWSIDFPNDSCTCSVPTDAALDCKSMPDPNSPTMMGRLTCPYPVRIYLDDIVWDTNPAPSADAGAPDSGTP